MKEHFDRHEQGTFEKKIPQQKNSIFIFLLSNTTYIAKHGHALNEAGTAAARHLATQIAVGSAAIRVDDRRREVG